MTRALDPLAFRHRAALLALVAGPITWGALAGPRAGPGEVAAGAALVAAGAALRLAAARRLGKRARVSTARADVVVTSGPYARVRNPLYLAALLVIVGLGLLAGLETWALAPAAWAWFVYDRAVRHEEATMSAQGGELGARYRAATPRWRPALVAFRGGEDLEPSPWSEVARREWRMLVGLPLAVVGVPALAALEPARAEAASLAAATGLPVAALVALAALCGAAGNALKVERDLARRARRREAFAAEQRAARPPAAALAVVAPAGALALVAGELARTG